MIKDVEHYQAWGGAITLPVWRDAQGWPEGNCAMPEVPGTPDPLWLQQILRGQKKLAALEQEPLLGA
jgi:hypothetical protein